MPNYELYRDDLEVIAEGEAETHKKIIDLMSDGMHKAGEKYGRSVRPSHAKAHALLTGRLVVRGDLPAELAQGLFAHPGTYNVIVRLASAPGELLDDSKVNATRGMAIKVLNAPGPMYGSYTGKSQDFLLSPGKEFIAPTAAVFLQAFKPNAELAPTLSDTTKGIASDVARATNKVLHMFGTGSGKLDFYGHPKYHPLGEGNYSQTPLRYGNYVAKLGVVPDTPALVEMLGKEYELKSTEALRDLCVAYFKDHAAEFSVQVQLNAGDDEMPIEDATAPWSENLSQYQEVARLILPPQEAWDKAKDAYYEDLSFDPAHTLAAHRPMGSINRARLAVYPVMASRRLAANHQQEIVPTSLAEVPA